MKWRQKISWWPSLQHFVGVGSRNGKGYWPDWYGLYKWKDYFTAFETLSSAQLLWKDWHLYSLACGHSISFSIGMIIENRIGCCSDHGGWRNRLTAQFTVLYWWSYLPFSLGLPIWLVFCSNADADLFDFAQLRGPVQKEQMRATVAVVSVIASEPDREISDFFKDLGLLDLHPGVVPLPGVLQPAWALDNPYRIHHHRHSATTTTTTATAVVLICYVF